MCHLSLKTGSADDGFYSTDYYRSMRSNLWLLREQNLYTDLEIECEDKIINVHRIVVAAGVEYFRQMLSANMSEAKNSKVKLNGIVSYEAIHQILNFAYTGQFHLDNNNIFEVMRAADFLLVDPVKQMCESFLLAHIDLNNCFAAKELSREILSDTLGAAVDEFVLKNFGHLCTNPNIGVYEFDEFQKLLRNDNLCVRHEIQVFQGIVQWVDYDHERFELLGLLLKSVRFLFMSLKEMELVAKHPYVRSSDVIKLITEVQNHVKESGKTLFNNLHPTILSAIEAKIRPEDCRFLPINRFSASGTLIFLGGRYESSNPCNVVETYNPYSDEWTYEEELCPFAGRQVGISVIGLDVYITGGYNARGQPIPSGILNSQTGKYTTIQQMPLSRRGCAVTQFVDKYVFALGGMDYVKYADLADVQCFNVETQSWTFVEPLLTKRRNLAAVSLDNFVYAIGGCFGDESFCLSSMERFNVQENRWEPLQGMKVGRYSCGAAVFGKHIYIAGGFGRESNRNKLIPLDSCEYYDVETGTWHDVAPLQTGRGAASLVTMDGHLYAIGGFNGKYLSSVERYDPILNKWTFCASIQQPRSGAGCAHIKELSRIN